MFGDHPYANTFKAMQIAVDGLPAELADGAARAGRVPAGRRADPRRGGRPASGPTPAATRPPRPSATCGGWPRRTCCSTRRRAASVSTTCSTTTCCCTRRRWPGCTPTCSTPTARCCRPARTRSGGSSRSTSPTCGITWSGTCAAPGSRRELAATVTDPAYLARRIATGGVHGAEADLAQAAAALPDAVDDRLVAELAEPARAPVGRRRRGGHRPRWTRGCAPTRARRARVDPDRLAPLLPDRPPGRALGTGRPVDGAAPRTHRPETRWVQAVAWSPDGTRLATASDDGTVRVWNPTTGHTTATLRGQPPRRLRAGLVPRRHPARHRDRARPPRSGPGTGRTTAPSPSRHLAEQRWPGPPTAPGSPRPATTTPSACGTPAPATPPAHRPPRLGARAGLVPRQHPPRHRRRRHGPGLGPGHRPHHRHPHPAGCTRWPGLPTAPASPPPATTAPSASGTRPPAN